jgi:hypothetical protein
LQFVRHRCLQVSGHSVAREKRMIIVEDRRGDLHGRFASLTAAATQGSHCQAIRRAHCGTKYCDTCAQQRQRQ